MTTDVDGNDVYISPAIHVGPRIDGRREQRVREADALALQLDQFGLDPTPQARKRVRLQGCRNDLDPRLRHRCCKEERVLRLARQSGKARAQQLAQLAGHGERLARRHLGAALVQCAGELKREERVAG